VVIHFIGEIAFGGVIVDAQQPSDNPPKKNYTQFPNDILEAILSTPFKSWEKDTLHLLVRLTYGYHKSHSPVTPKDVKKYTHRHINSVRQAIRDLMKRNVVIRTEESRRGHSARYKINEDIDEWMVTK
jgi:phage replication O-like protein O